MMIGTEEVGVMNGMQMYFFLIDSLHLKEHNAHYSSAGHFLLELQTEGNLQRTYFLLQVQHLNEVT